MKWRAILCGLVVGACTSSSGEAPVVAQWTSVNVEAVSVETDVEQVGRLRFRGGLQLIMRDDNSEHDFGGLSGLEILEDNRFLAVSDYGDWIEARLVLDESGALVGFADPRGARQRDEHGDVFINKEASDAEGLTQLPDGRFAVSYEQTQSIRVFDLNRDGPFGASRAGPRPEGAPALPGNVGLEALASTAEGELVIGAEGGSTETTPLWLAPLDAQAPVPAIAQYKPEHGFSLTSLDRLPNGDFVALERFFSPVIGPRARITRFSAAALRAGGVIEPEELARLAPPFPIDHFEGIAATRAPDGGVRLYVLSDDNFSARQRTLLLAFDVVE